MHVMAHMAAINDQPIAINGINDQRHDAAHGVMRHVQHAVRDTTYTYSI
jgi:hypothetical protein